MMMMVMMMMMMPEATDLSILAILLECLGRDHTNDTQELRAQYSWCCWGGHGGS
jgi:hypothetical protein